MIQIPSNCIYAITYLIGYIDIYFYNKFYTYKKYIIPLSDFNIFKILNYRFNNDNDKQFFIKGIYSKKIIKTISPELKLFLKLNTTMHAKDKNGNYKIS